MEAPLNAPQRPDLAAELARRQDVDQKARAFAIGDQPTDAEIDWMRQVDQDNTAWLESAVAEHGWPGFRLVGAQGASSAWLLAQHADRRPELQRCWLTLLEAAVQAGDASHKDLAYLQDRVATHERIPQRHGTQWLGSGGKSALAPLADPRRVNEYRAAVGLDPLNDHEIAAAWQSYPW